MPREILHLYKHPEIDFSVRVPTDWDYWTYDGERVNFRIKKLENPDHPNHTGFYIILWIFSIALIWMKPRNETI
jgi:hypothetical protein